MPLKLTKAFTALIPCTADPVLFWLVLNVSIYIPLVPASASQWYWGINVDIWIDRGLYDFIKCTDTEYFGAVVDQQVICAYIHFWVYNLLSYFFKQNSSGNSLSGSATNQLTRSATQRVYYWCITCGFTNGCVFVAFVEEGVCERVCTQHLSALRCVFVCASTCRVVGDWVKQLKPWPIY